MSRKAAKCRQKPPKKRELYTAEPVRGRVLARHMGGQSNRRIATEERIDRDTVSRILSQREVVQMIAQYQSRLLSMVPKAIAAFDAALESDDERVRLAAATKLLEGLQVLQRGGIEKALETGAAFDRQRNEQRWQVLGQITDMLLQKNQQFGVPLPPGFEGLEDRLKALPA
jgi:hypothetical protein